MGKHNKLFQRMLAIALSLGLVLSLTAGIDFGVSAKEVSVSGFEQPQIIVEELTQEEYDQFLLERQRDVTDNYKSTDSYWSKFSVPYYSYSVANFTDSEKKFYDGAYTALYGYIDGGQDFTKEGSDYYTPYIDYENLTIDQVQNIAFLLMYEHPELYFLAKSCRVMKTGVNGSIRFEVYGDFAKSSARKTASETLKEKINWYLSQVKSTDSLYEQEKQIHDLICKNVVYDENAAYNQSCASVFFKGRSVCAGMSEAFELLCNASGMSTVSITSSAHQWNEICLDGVWYGVDVTWDNMTYGPIHQYFDVSDSTLKSGNDSHNPSDMWSTVGREPCLYDYGYAPVQTTYTLEFDGNGATSGATQSISGIKKTSSVTIPECGYDKEGYTFEQWNTDANGKGISLSPGKVINGLEIAVLAKDKNEVTLYAIWNKKQSDNVISIDEKTGTATVKDDVNGDTAVVPIEYIEEGDVYRMYDSSRGEHFYTKNKTEVLRLISLGWTHEYNADFTVADATDIDAIPVYRMYNPNAGGMHFYTQNAAEAKNLISVGWSYEGISHYVYNQNATDKGTLQFRLRNPNSPNGEHNWTADISEYNYLKSLGWEDEGACWRIV